jgi:hypothetical protein
LVKTKNMSEEKNRMRDLVKMFEKKDEIFSNDKKEINEDILSDEYKRLKDIATGSRNAVFKEGLAISNDWNTGGQGMSVSTIGDSAYGNPSVTFNAIRQPLKNDEAFEIAIKRTIESGAPVNDLGFYDEVNLNLNQLGFPAKNPIDIKNKIVTMISNKDRN